MPGQALDRDTIMAFFRNLENLPPATALFGFELLDLNLETRTVEAGFTVKPEFLNPHGSVQGGIVTGFLDEAMSCAIFVASNLEAATPTLEMKTSFLRPLTTPKARATGRVVSMGQSFGFTEGELFNADGALCAKASATSIIRYPET